jgi:hypothetical protein
MTNFELIKSFDVNSMACMLAQICYERDEKLLHTLAKQGFDASLVKCPKLQVEIHKKWLLEEADFSKESEDGK